MQYYSGLYDLVGIQYTIAVPKAMTDVEALNKVKPQFINNRAYVIEVP